MDNQLLQNNIKEEDPLMKEIIKMSYIKYLNLIFSIIRFILIFVFICLVSFIPISFKPNIFTSIIFLYKISFIQLSTIYLLIVVSLGTFRRNFIKGTDQFNYALFSICCGCCFFCCYSNNVSFFATLTFFCSIICFFWTFILFYYYMKDLSYQNNNIYFPIIMKLNLARIIVDLIDSLLLLSQFYFFKYWEYFLGRVNQYIEYYKRLVIKNKTKEANFVRNLLPYQIDNYIPNNGEEVQNV